MCVGAEIHHRKFIIGTSIGVSSCQAYITEVTFVESCSVRITMENNYKNVVAPFQLVGRHMYLYVMVTFGI